MTRSTKLTNDKTTRGRSPAEAHETAAVEEPVHDFHLPDDMVLDEKKFGRHMRMVETLGKRTGIKVHVSQSADALRDGDIFLFNHFTRFETVVAPYIIHRETGKLVRSVAYAGLFDVNDTMSRILHEAGGVPTNMPRLLAFLAEEILRGRKVIIFPEGGLVKDKHVLDAQGNLKMWSGMAEKVRKPHRGAAVLALMLDLAKRRIRALIDAEDSMALCRWCEKLDLSLEQLKLAVAKPTLIVPTNITFYPMRTNPNVLLRSLEKIAGPQGARARDEITIEGNLLLRPTDMDVRFGSPVSSMEGVKRLHHAVLDHALSSTHTMDDVFALKDATEGMLESYVAKFVSRQVDKIREVYARKIYLGTTININHLTATLVKILTEQGRWEIAKKDFHMVLYVALKTLQHRGDVNLHPTLARPELYATLTEGKSRGFMGFLEACTRAKLIKSMNVGGVGPVYRFSHRLNDVMDLQDIRLENPLQVHVNEAEPIAAVRDTVAEVLARIEKVTETEMAMLRFDDMVREHAGQRYRFSKKAPSTLLGPDNAHTGRPYLLLPELMGKHRRKAGVVLVHGFATTPGELRAYADHLREQGSVVIGVRLPGHGTSMLDLEARTRGEWLKAVRDGYEIAAALADEVVIVGFSTGGALGLLLAQEKLPKLVRIASIAAPLLVRDGNMGLLPIGMVLRSIFKHIPGLRDTLRFYEYERENTAAMYRDVPVTALNELRLLIREMRNALPKVTVPTLIMQGLLDHTVKTQSAALIYKLLGSSQKILRWVAGGPHGLVTHNFGATWDVLDRFVSGHDVAEPVAGKVSGGDHKILVEPSVGKKKTAFGQLIRKSAI